MNILKIILLLFFYGQIYAQAPAIQWQKSFGGSLREEMYGLKQTLDGGFILAGFSASTDGDITENYGGYDMCILKLNANGELEWHKTLGGNFSDFANDVIQSTDGGYVIVGNTNSTSNDVTELNGGNDCWIVKLNAAGQIEWQNTLGGSLNENGFSVDQCVDGGYVVAGYSESVDGDVTTNKGNRDFWILKLDASGNLLWEKSFGGTNEDEAESVRETADGGYILGGTTYSGDGDVNGHHGAFDIWILKLDADRNIEWQKSLGGSGSEIFRSMEVTDDNGFIISGSASSNNGDVTGVHGTKDAWVVKLNEDGQIEWQKALGGSQGDDGYSVKQSNDGGFIIGGLSNSSDGDVTGNHGDYDYWVTKLDNNGSIQWEKSLGGSEEDNARSIVQTVDGGFFVAGESKSNDGDVTVNNGDYDIWVVKLESPTSIHSIHSSQLISVFPNPLIGEDLHLNINSEASEKVLITIEDQYANLNYSAYKQLSAGKNEWSLQDVLTKAPDGVYFLTINSIQSGTNRTYKIMKLTK